MGSEHSWRMAHEGGDRGGLLSVLTFAIAAGQVVRVRWRARRHEEAWVETGLPVELEPVADPCVLVLAQRGFRRASNVTVRLCWVEAVDILGAGTAGDGAW